MYEDILEQKQPSRNYRSTHGQMQQQQPMGVNADHHQFGEEKKMYNDDEDEVEDEQKQQQVSIQFNNYQRQLMLHHEGEQQHQMWYNNLIMKTVSAAAVGEQQQGQSNHQNLLRTDDVLVAMGVEIESPPPSNREAFVLRERNGVGEGGDGAEEMMNRWKSQRSPHTLGHHYF